MKRFLSGLLVAAACVMTVAATAQVATAPEPRHPQPVAHGKPVEISMTRAGSTSVDLRQLPPGKIKKRERPEREGPEPNPTELPGSTFHYAIHYRNPVAGFCDPGLFNASNGYTIAW